MPSDRNLDTVSVAQDIPDHVDVLIVGSGPVGCTFAREIHDLAPHKEILMIDAGPQLTNTVGENVRNLDQESRLRAQNFATAWTGQPTSDSGRYDNRLVARPGTFLLQSPDGVVDDQSGMPAAAMAANVGGMGAHWTCACPPPGDSERITFLEDVFDEAFERAKELLGVRQDAFPDTPAQRSLLRLLSETFDDGRPPERRVQPMPLACTPSGAPLPHWSGVNTVLGPMAEGSSEFFRLVANTVCLNLKHSQGRVRAAILLDRDTGQRRLVTFDAVVVAADALRTPQLLWASEVRPAALGRYLNDQPQIVSALALRERESSDSGGYGAAADLRDRLTGVLWIPFHEPDFPFHTQVMQLGTTPIDIPNSDPENRPVVTWGRFTTKEVREEDRLEFDDAERDAFGLPKITIHYELTDGDRATIARAMKEMVAQAETIGDFFPGSHPRLLPAGSSMHYQGTVRMGEKDDGTSVCDPSSRVWGFDNLYVGGNGVIPTPTACNPTATSVALAVLAARRLVTAA